MTSAISTAISGMRANLARFDASAARIASPTLETNVTDELVGQLEARTGFDANAKVLETASRMERFMIELWA